jgi:hypothetical protein
MAHRFGQRARLSRERIRKGKHVFSTTSGAVRADLDKCSAEPPLRSGRRVQASGGGYATGNDSGLIVSLHVAVG